MRNLSRAIAALLLPALCGLSHAQEVEIASEKLTAKGPVLVLEGSVLIKRGDASIRAQRAVYNSDTGEVSAEGDIRYEDPEASITAERADVNLRTERGVLYNAAAFFKKDHYRFTGTEIHRTGKDRYLIKRGSATTCEGLPPAWCFGGNDIDILLGERIKARNVTFRIKGVPVLYTPYLWAPIVTERRTGLLSPTLGYRDLTGFFYRQPFFWAMAENRDATFFLDYYSERAFGQGLEYRYVEGPGIRGSLNLYRLADAIRDRDFVEVRAGHRQTGRYVSGFLDLKHINHRGFYRIYEPYVEQSSKRFLESSAEVHAPFGNSRLYLLGRYYQDLKDGVEQGAVLQRLPEFGFFFAPDGLGPVLFQGTARAARFERDVGLRGERYDIELKGTHFLGTGPVLTQTARARQFLYETEDDSTGPVLEESLDNRVYEYEATFLGAFERVFGQGRHIVENFLSYRYVELQGDGPPFFDSTEQAADASLASLTVLNRLLDGKGEFMTLKVSQSYDFLLKEDELLPLLADITFRRPVNLSVGAAYDHAEDEFASARAKVDVKAGKTGVTANYFYTRSTGVNVYEVDVNQGVGRRLALSAGVRYDDEEEGGAEELRAGIRYTSQCWGVELAYVERPEDYSVFVNLSLLGLGNFEAR